MISTDVPRELSWVIAHVRYTKILTWLQGFRVIFQQLVWFSWCSSLFWELRWSQEKFAILPLKPRSLVRILIHRTIYPWIKRLVWPRLYSVFWSYYIYFFLINAYNVSSGLLCFSVFTSCILSWILHTLCSKTSLWNLKGNC